MSDGNLVTHCPCCMSNTCLGRQFHEEIETQLRDVRRERDRYKRAFERNRIVIEMLAKYPEEDEHGR